MLYHGVTQYTQSAREKVRLPKKMCVPKHRKGGHSPFQDLKIVRHQCYSSTSDEVYPSDIHMHVPSCTCRPYANPHTCIIRAYMIFG